MLNSHVWLVAILSDRADRELFCHCFQVISSVARENSLLFMALQALGILDPLNPVEFEMILNWTSVLMRAGILLTYFSVLECSLLISHLGPGELSGWPQAPSSNMDLLRSVSLRKAMFSFLVMPLPWTDASGREAGRLQAHLSSLPFSLSGEPVILQLLFFRVFKLIFFKHTFVPSFLVLSGKVV